MQLHEVMHQLEEWGSEQTRRIYANHGVTGSFYGVKVGDLKKIVKKVKKNHALAKELYDTGNMDAMYLAGLIADEEQMTKEDLQKWAKEARWYMISEYSVAGVAAETPYGLDLAREWIKSDIEHIETTGWATYNGILSLKDDTELDLQEIDKLLDFIGENIHQSKNRVRYTMNGFVISVGAYIAPLVDKAKVIAEKIGKVSVDMGGTACKVPFAPEYINKIETAGRIGQKRKTARC